MTGNLAVLKQQCLQTYSRGKLFARQVEKINDPEELKDFCRRKRIDLPGFTENYRFQFNSAISQYAVHEQQLEYEEIKKPEYHRSLESVSVQNNNPPQRNPPTCTESTRLDNIRELIKDEIGTKWKQLGRRLGFSDGYFEQLEYDYPRNFRELIHTLLNQAITDSGSEQAFISKLSFALEKIGRNDLVRQIPQL